MVERRVRLASFGDCLKQARNKMGITQTQLALEVTRILSRNRHNKKVSQGLIAQYETGLIADPDPAVLESIANVLTLDWLEVACLLMREKYDPAGRWKSGKDKLRWDVFEATWKQEKLVGEQKDTDGSIIVQGVKGLDDDQLRAKADLVERGIFLPVKALARWEVEVTGISEYWILAPDFLAVDDPMIQEAVVKNLSKTPPVGYVYYLNPSRRDNFLAYQTVLANRADLSRDRRRNIDQLVRCEELEEDALRWLSADHLVAIPKNPERPIIFRYLRLGEQLYAYRTSPYDVNRILAGLKNWLARRSIRTKKKR